MGKDTKQLNREAVLQSVLALAKAKANDAVRLTFIKEEQTGSLGRLDLTALKEFKRSAGGVTEIKLIDRVAALELLLEQMEEKSTQDGLLQVLDSMGREDETDEDQ